MPEENLNDAPGLLADADPVSSEQPAQPDGAGAEEKQEHAEGKTPENGEGEPSGKPETDGKPDAEPEKKDDGGEKELAKAWKDFAANPQNGVDPEIFASFADSAKQMGLKPEQARDLVAWQMHAIEKQAARMREEGMVSLKQEWGNATKGNLGMALELVTAIDRKCDGAFSKSLGKFGIANDADFIRGLHYMASMLGEDSLAALHSGSGMPQKEETPYEGIVNALKELKR